MSDTSDPVVVPAHGITVAFSPADEPDKIAAHLVMELPTPIGRLHVVLADHQIATLHDTLHRAITMTPDEVADFVAHINEGKNR